MATGLFNSKGDCLELSRTIAIIPSHWHYGNGSLTFQRQRRPAFAIKY
jgi:hypothetical protein